VKHTFRAALLAGVLLVGLAAPVAPAFASTSSTSGAAVTASASAPSAASADRTQSRAVKWLLDRVAITKVQLSPLQKRLVNMVIRATSPIFCPLLAKAAAPQFQAFVKQSCLTLGASPDPWASLVAFAPQLCATYTVVFPNFVALFKVTCGLLL